jgi:hypothetical protein
MDEVWKGFADPFLFLHKYGPIGLHRPVNQIIFRMMAMVPFG